MRDIKFRAWHKILKQMCNVGLLDIINQEIWPGYSGISYSFKGIDLMQYTGLKDRNGKEIYEGDIIRATNEPNFPKKTIYEGRIGVITYNDDSPEFVIKGNFMFQHIQLFNGVAYEVIGNIYENPELLNK